MHDWILVNISYLWEDGKCILKLKDSTSGERSITAYGVSKLFIPRKDEWGPSTSVNKIIGPIEELNEVNLKIEMQSGDTIELIGEKIVFSSAEEENNL